MNQLICVSAALFPLTVASVSAQSLIASDDFDAALKLTGYSAIDAEGNDPENWGFLGGSTRDNFGIRNVDDFFFNDQNLSDAVMDRTNTQGGDDDGIGIVTFDYPDGNFFSIVDTDNGANPSGVVTGTWTFDISSAASLTEFAVDMAAVGKFFDDGDGLFEQFTWSYAIDGGASTDLFTIRADASLGSVTYTMVDGSNVTVPGDSAPGPDDNGVSIDGTALLNELTTVTSPLNGSGSLLTLELNGYVNDNEAGIVVDNIAILGLTETGGLNGDANGDGRVDLLDLDILGSNWLNSPADLSDGDFNGDNVVNLLDLDILGANWQDGSSFSAALAANPVPEPGSVGILALASLGLTSRRTSRRRA